MMETEAGASPSAVEPVATPNAADAGAEVATGAESATAAAEPSVKTDKIQERFDKLTRDKYDALRQADTERYQRERLEERLRALEAKPEPVAPVTPPTLESVGYDEAKFAAAQTEHQRQIARNEAREILAAERRKDAEAAAERDWQKRETDFAKSKPDYHEKVHDPSLPITSQMAEAMRESDIGPMVAYYLSEHRDMARAISALSPIGQAREIGRIEAALEAAKAVETKPVVSKAPPPPATLEATEPATRITPDSPESDTAWSAEEWAKRRNKQLASRRK